MRLHKRKAFILVFLLLYPLSAKAKPVSDDSVKKKPSYLTNSLLLIVGILTQYPVAHEIGHWIGGRVMGNDIEFNASNLGGFDIDKRSSRQDKSIISSSGFIFPMLVSEMVIDTSVSKGNPYIMGLIIGPLVHNTSYIIQDLTDSKSDNYNDFETMEKAGIGREWTYSLALIIPAIQCYRLSQDKNFKIKWNIWFGGDKIGVEYKF